MKYSRLAFSHQQDRPIAIAGLEKRLIHSFGVHGGFGVLDDDGPGLLRRSLLWCRGSDEASLEKITFGGNERLQVAPPVPPPPTWSWMAYKGGIDYLNLPFGNVDWEGEGTKAEGKQNNTLSPWSRSPVGTWYSDYSGTGLTGLSVIARDFEFEETTRSDAEIIYDITTKEHSSLPGMKCVILGTEKNPTKPEAARTHYVLLVRPKTPLVSDEELIYERAGVGCMPGSWIQFDQPRMLARVF